MKWPRRYFSGLSLGQKRLREKELIARASKKHPTLGPTDMFAKKRKSSWTVMFHKTYPNLKFNKGLIASRTGIPRKNLDIVYNRGLKAWKTSGSRPGATAQQWAIARLYKFVLISKGKAATKRKDPNNNLRRVHWSSDTL
jgi:hypothetical protein